MIDILIADDEDAIRKILRQVLTEEGYVVLEAFNGEVALQTILLHPQPLITILDYMMPKMTGWQVLLELEQRPPLLTPRAYVLFSAVSTIFVTLANHPFPFPVMSLEKPFAINDLLQHIATLTTQLLASDTPAGNLESA